MNKKMGKMLSVLYYFFATSSAFATAYPIPPGNEALIGEMQYSSATDSIVNLQKRYNVGFNALQNANPSLDLTKSLPYGVSLRVPTHHLLPNQPRQGIVVNLPEMRMYYYVNDTQVLTYPIGIGKIGKTIPIALTAITKKVKDPSWSPPEDIRQFQLEQGVILPAIMPAGPDNPLGPYAIYMKIPTYLIHSTIFPESIGKRASFGCIRMYESDIQEFFPSVQSNIPVAIVNAPVKAGWQNNHLYVEAHPPLEEHSDAYESSVAGVVHLVSTVQNNQPALIDWQGIAFVTQARDGVPHEIGMRLN